MWSWLGTNLGFVQLGSDDTNMEEERNVLNGLILSNTYFPEEALLNILVHVPWKDQLTCRLVCQSWRRLIDYPLSTEKLERFSPSTFNSSFSPSRPQVGRNRLKADTIPFFVYYLIGKGLFVKNLLQNPSGSGEDCDPLCEPKRRFWEEGRSYAICSTENCPRFRNWTITESGGHGWIAESPPRGCQPLPEHLGENSCFATSFGTCVKHQLIDLCKAGFSHKVMDEVVPHIEVSEWYARRFDCGIRYDLRIRLLNKKKEIVDAFVKNVVGVEDDEWHQVKHVFKNYGPGVRFVLFEHKGRDTQAWAGHYGAKISGGSVVLRIPLHLYQQPE